MASRHKQGKRSNGMYSKFIIKHQFEDIRDLFLLHQHYLTKTLKERWDPEIELAYEFSYVNPRHHTSCLAESDNEDLTLNLSRRPPDPFYVPAAAQPFLKVKKANISEENVINLCRSARVYFNSYNRVQTRGKLKKRFEEVNSPRKVQETDRKLIPLQGYEDEAAREERVSHRNRNSEQLDADTEKHSRGELSHRGSRSTKTRSNGSNKQHYSKENGKQ